MTVILSSMDDRTGTLAFVVDFACASVPVAFTAALDSRHFLLNKQGNGYKTNGNFLDSHTFILSGASE